MTTIIIMTTILISLTSLIMMIASLLSIKSIKDREKCSPFECGFDPKSSSRLPFSLQFYLIAIVFIIFDVEIALILPLPLTLEYSQITKWTLTGFIFCLILLLGLYHEWNQGALQWAH